MIERGCPNCGCNDSVEIEVCNLSTESMSYLICDKAKEFTLYPKICLNCGSIFIDINTLRDIKSLIKLEKELEK